MIKCCYCNIKNWQVILLAFLLLPLIASAGTLKLATTTSTQNSGLLDQLLPPFTVTTGIQVHVIAVGTGKALKMGQDGDVDVVMVHAEKAEKKFIEQGNGTDRKQFMYNDFVLVGPATDPAKVSTAKSVSQALTYITKNKSSFLSRGDDSGTHKKELALWQQANIKPSGNWYREVGQGMGKILQMASELQAYTLTDRGTWLAMKHTLDLKLLFSGDKGLSNPYGIIAVSQQKYPDINYHDALALISWVCSKKAQQIITDFKINGEPLFIPVNCQ